MTHKLTPQVNNKISGWILENNTGWDAKDNVTIHFESFADFLNALTVKNEGKWISVEDRLPEANEITCVCFDNKYGYQEYEWGYISRHPSTKGEWFTKKGGYAIDNVTHWQPLPEPPPY